MCFAVLLWWRAGGRLALTALVDQGQPVRVVVPEGLGAAEAAHWCGQWPSFLQRRAEMALVVYVAARHWGRRAERGEFGKQLAHGSRFARRQRQVVQWRRADRR